MSTTYELVCHETKQKLWVGQGRGGTMTTFYSGEPETMHDLGRFLAETMGKSLVLMTTEDMSSDDAFDDYVDFREVP